MRDLDEKQFVAKLFQFPTLFSTDMVDIFVGISPNSISRRVPKNALIEHSQYFKVFFDFEQKCNSSVVSSKHDLVEESAITERDVNNTIRLETEVDRPDAFDMFIHYIYWQDYQPTLVKDAVELLDDFDFRPHVHVYILAEKLQVDGLKDLALRKATHICAKLAKKVKENFKNTGEDEEGKESRIQVGNILNNIPEMIEVIYTNTPTATVTPVQEQSAEEEPTPLSTIAEDASNNIQEEKEGERSNPTTVNIGRGCSTDPFRTLLAAVSASCLRKLKAVPSFGECLQEIPDFAVDLVTRLLEVEPFGVTENGYMVD